jgi:hypothetical protein
MRTARPLDQFVTEMVDASRSNLTNGPVNLDTMLVHKPQFDPKAFPASRSSPPELPSPPTAPRSSPATRPVESIRGRPAGASRGWTEPGCFGDQIRQSSDESNPRGLNRQGSGRDSFPNFVVGVAVSHSFPGGTRSRGKIRSAG